MKGPYLYSICLLAFSLLMPASWWNSASPDYLLAFGAIAVWRYSWAGIHFVRFVTYRHIVFPRMRRAAAALSDDDLPADVYLLLTSFRIDTDTTKAVYAAAIREAINYGRPVTLVASIVEMADQRLIKHLFQRLNPPEHVKLMFVRIGGTGKRDALAQGFRAISQSRPSIDAVVAVIDGDSIIEPGMLRSVLPFFSLYQDVDALTTDEVCEVNGAPIFRDWYNMRFAQRQILMCSIGLSRRVLTLTGRMSVFRASVACSPEFIATVENDTIEHWRMGTLKFLTGDDKSSWYHILSSGRGMLYIPDARVITIETPPDPKFFRAAGMLMVRWFGNMLRTNGRAIALGPSKMTAFVWLAVLDQRLSAWTSLTGFIAALLLTIFVAPHAIFLYFYWVALTRFIQTLGLLSARNKVAWNYPFLLFFNQVFGSFVKIYILFHLDRQKWTRQKTNAARTREGWDHRLVSANSAALHICALTIFVTLIFASLGLLVAPGPWLLPLFPW